MIVIQTVIELKEVLEAARSRGMKINFVPTMGALHKGHVSLIEYAMEKDALVVCSIFVNPVQFNDKTDLERYPRPLEKDKEILEKAGCDILFIPSKKEIYPEPDNRKFDFGSLDKVMEGKYRPGHFNGVAVVVSRLFDIVKPDNAFFGQKDFQQVAIIKCMVKMLSMPVHIVVCPTMREADGLAMSSRNVFLSPEERKAAALISKILFGMQERKNKMSVEELISWANEQFKTEPLLQPEYIEITDADTLIPAKNISNAVVCIAVKTGGVRLIDNVIMK